ncbi:hypothetical protein CCACVL1_04472 [Corchorus capsularis]|uniref:SET domain-containing protein n=1 Tax=Corchorus capsularis TaxID=210143 RepID=A0A1R3JSG1_COCAP|nr:hypothetical protein CCACVL1_04472 [Corchorus capsularis]
MDKTFVGGQGDDQRKEDSLRNLENNKERSKDNGMNYSELKLKKLARRVNPQHALIFDAKRLQAGKSLLKDSLLQSIFRIGNKIPRHVVTLDEKYLRRCLESIRISAAKAAQCDISLNLSSVKMGILADGLNSAKIRVENTCDSGRFVFECPLAVGSGSGSLVIGPAGQWVVGSIMGSKSMANILKSPLLQKLGALDAGARVNDVKGSISYDFMSSPGGFSFYPTPKLGSETPILGNHKDGREAVNNRLVSLSSTNSTCSDQSFSSTSTTISQGMLQCTWKNGIPHFVFSVDDQREVYVANLTREKSVGHRGQDYMYLFHSSKGKNKDHGIRDNESDLVGKMRVSTSFSISPQDSKLMETQFVLFSGDETFDGEMQTSSHNYRKNKGLSKKVVKVFKSSHSSKQRTMPRFHRSGSLIEESSWDPCQDTVKNPAALSGTNLLEDELPPNLELAAIVVKDRVPETPRQEVGGWGLKFLKKAGVKQAVGTLEAPVSSACARNTGDCSTSMDILVPAGIHGGPRTRNGGPSSLIERWRSGGHCDCGGWDLGCPLTVLKAKSSKEDCSPPIDMSEACKLFDFVIKGSEHGAPTLRIANVHDGLWNPEERIEAGGAWLVVLLNLKAMLCNANSSIGSIPQYVSLKQPYHEERGVYIMSTKRKQETDACKAMKPFGFIQRQVKSAIKELLPLYGGSWELIKDANYGVLLEFLLSNNEGEDKVAKSKPEVGKKRSTEAPKKMEVLPLPAVSSDSEDCQPLLRRSRRRQQTDNSNPVMVQNSVVKVEDDENEQLVRLLPWHQIEKGSVFKKSDLQLVGSTIERVGWVAAGGLTTDLGTGISCLATEVEPKKEQIPSASELDQLPLAVVHPETVEKHTSACGTMKAILYVDDISKGEERVKISLVNRCTDEELPDFPYISQNFVYDKAYVNFTLASITDKDCCSRCLKDCLTCSMPCACANRTGGEFVYAPGGLLKDSFLEEIISSQRFKRPNLIFCRDCPLERSKGKYEPKSCKGHLERKFIKECWSKCRCSKQCGNRVVQRGISVALQVFETPEGKGWGVRSVNDLPRGAFVCEYVGEIITNAEMHERIMQSRSDNKNRYLVPLDADWCCDANLVEIPVEVESPDHHYYHFAFFTTREIAAMEELTWDYGIEFGEQDHHQPVQAFKCLCGSSFCCDKNR